MSRKDRKPAASRSKRQDLNITGSSRFIVGDNASIFLPPREPLTWPVRVGQPPRLAAAFQPRSISLPTLSDSPSIERLAPGGDEVTDGHSLVLFGEAGAGKSQIAATYFYEAQQRGTELAIWVPAASRSQIIDTYVEARIRIDSGSLDIVRDPERLAVGLLDWLATTVRTWLVVLDDVTEAVDIRGLWPYGPAGTVVMTTKRRDLRPTGAIAREVGMFTHEESVNYLTERLTKAAKNDLLDDPGGIAEDLQNRPVALAQAAAYLLAENLTCHEYRARLAEAGRRLEDLLPSHTPADEYPHTTSRAAILALDAANRLPPFGLAKPALCLAAVLDPAGAPTTLWNTSRPGPTCPLIARWVHPEPNVVARGPDVSVFPEGNDPQLSGQMMRGPPCRIWTDLA